MGAESSETAETEFGRPYAILLMVIIVIVFTAVLILSVLPILLIFSGCSWLSSSSLSSREIFHELLQR